MRMRLLTTAAALALLAAMAGPGTALAAGETPTSSSGATVGTSTSPTLAPSGISTNASGSMGSSGSFGMSGSASRSVPIDSTIGGPLVIGTQGLLLPPDYATGARAFYRSDYIGAPYETSMGGTEHARRAMDGELEGSRYQALAREIQAGASETRGMADRNGTLFDPSAEELLDID